MQSNTFTNFQVVDYVQIFSLCNSNNLIPFKEYFFKKLLYSEIEVEKIELFSWLCFGGQCTLLKKIPESHLFVLKEYLFVLKEYLFVLKEYLFVLKEYLFVLKEYLFALKENLFVFMFITHRFFEKF